MRELEVHGVRCKFTGQHYGPIAGTLQTVQGPSLHCRTREAQVDASYGAGGRARPAPDGLVPGPGEDVLVADGQHAHVVLMPLQRAQALQAHAVPHLRAVQKGSGRSGFQISDQGLRSARMRHSAPSARPTSPLQLPTYPTLEGPQQYACTVTAPLHRGMRPCSEMRRAPAWRQHSQD